MAFHVYFNNTTSGPCFRSITISYYHHPPGQWSLLSSCLCPYFSSLITSSHWYSTSPELSTLSVFAMVLVRLNLAVPLRVIWLTQLYNCHRNMIDHRCESITSIHKYSLLMHRIKIKLPAIFLMGWIKRFCGWIYHFSISLTLVVLQRQKSLPDIGGATIQDVVSHLG